MKRWMWLAFALSACGEEPPDLNGDGQADAPGSVTQIAPVHPVASVSGYVYDVATGQAIEGASVSLFASSEHSETTGVDGYVNFFIAAGGTRSLRRPQRATCRRTERSGSRRSLAISVGEQPRHDGAHRVDARGAADDQDVWLGSSG